MCSNSEIEGRLVHRQPSTWLWVQLSGAVRVRKASAAPAPPVQQTGGAKGSNGPLGVHCTFHDLMFLPQRVWAFKMLFSLGRE